MRFVAIDAVDVATRGGPEARSFFLAKADLTQVLFWKFELTIGLFSRYRWRSKASRDWMSKGGSGAMEGGAIGGWGWKLGMSTSYFYLSQLILNSNNFSYLLQFSPLFF